MADIEDALNEMDQKKTSGDKTGETSPKKKKSEKKSGGQSPLVKYGIYAAIILVQVVLSYVIIAEVILPKPDPGSAPAANSDSTQTQPEKPPLARQSKPVQSREDTERSFAEADSLELLSSKDMDAIAGVFTLSDMVVNPAYSQGRRYFVVSIVMAFEDKKVVALAEARQAILNDRINTLLSKRSYQWFLNFNNRDVLKYDIRNVVMDVLGVNDGVHIFFTKYVIQ